MDDLEKRLREVEDAIFTKEPEIKDTDSIQKPVSVEKKSGLAGIPYLYIGAAAIPILTVLILYFVKPKMVIKRKGGKKVLDKVSLAKWTAIITAIGWALLFALYYMGVIKR